LRTLEDILPVEENFTNNRTLETEVPVSASTKNIANFSTYGLDKREGEYSLNNDYFASKNYEFQNQTPDGSPDVLMGSDFEREKNPQKSYDNENERKERMKRF